jgi:PAS domain-containing protein
MLGSPLARTAAFAALLTLVLVGWDQCASRDLNERALAEVDASLEQTARAIAGELGDRAVGEFPPRSSPRSRTARPVCRRARDADRYGRLPARRLRGDGARTCRDREPRPARGGARGRSGRVSGRHAIEPHRGRTLRYVAVPAPGGGVVRVSDDLSDVEQRVALARSHALSLIAIAAVSALALLHAFVWLFHRRPLAGLRRSRPRRGRPARRARVALRRSRRGPDRPLDRAARRPAALALREVSEDEAQLGAVLEAMVEGVLVVDARGVILLANSRCASCSTSTARSWAAGCSKACGTPTSTRSSPSRPRPTRPVARSIALPGPNHRTLQVLAARFPSVGERTGTVTVLHDTTELMRSRRCARLRRERLPRAAHAARGDPRLRRRRCSRAPGSRPRTRRTTSR